MGKSKDIRVAVEAELAFDPLSDPVNITVKNMNGRFQRAAAEQVVAGLTGVRNIKNDIEVVYGADPVDVTVLVRSALYRYALVTDDSDVAADTRGNTVVLSGHVRTWAERDAVVGAAWMANGVVEVDDNLYITG